MRTSLLFILLACLIPAWGFSQCNPHFYDGFESGSYTPTWSIGGGLTSGAVTTTNPYSGLYRLEGTGGTSTHLTGFSTTFPAATPSTMSWDVYPTGTGASNYVVAGTTGITPTNCIMFCYWQGGNNLRFVSSTTAIYNCTPNAWYHIEMRNINWTTHVFDIYINNTLVQASFPFRSASINSVTAVHLYNFNSAVGVWDNIQIGQANSPIATSMVTNALCNGTATGAVDLSVTAGTPNYSYVWSNGASTQDITGIGAGNYTVTVTDNAACTTTATVTVTQPTALTQSQALTNLSCNASSDGAIDNTPGGGTPGYDYSWSTGDTTQDLSGLAAGTYTITLTDANNCTHTDTVVVTEPAAIAVNDSTYNPTCNGAATGYIFTNPTGGNGGYTYLWTGGATTSTYGPVVAGTYTVLVTDAMGCTTLDSVTLTQPAALVYNITGTNPLCTGDSNGTATLVISGGTPGYSQLWSNGSTSPSLTGLGPGTYQVSIVDGNSCFGSDTIVLVDPLAIAASGVVTDAVGANNGAVDLTASGGTGNLDYVWSNGAITQDISGLGAGTYSVTITDANGCSITLSFTVNFIISTGDAHSFGVALVPNPFSQAFAVQLSGLGNESAQLSLTDLQGKVLWMQANVSQTQVLVTPDVAAGTYLLRVQVGEHVQTLRVMRQ